MLIPDWIPAWVWVLVLIAGAVHLSFKGLAHRRALLAAASAPGAGEAEQNALKRQALGGIGMAMVFGGILLAYVLPRPYGLITILVGTAGCWLCVLMIRRAQPPNA